VFLLYILSIPKRQLYKLCKITKLDKSINAVRQYLTVDLVLPVV